MIIEDYLKQTCYKMSDGIDGWDKPKILDTPIALKCQWIEKFKLIKDKTGKEVVSKIQVKLLPNAEIKVDDLISIDQENNYSVISIEDKTDIFGNVKLKVVYC